MGPREGSQNLLTKSEQLIGFRPALYGTVSSERAACLNDLYVVLVGAALSGSTYFRAKLSRTCHRNKVFALKRNCWPV